MVVRKKSRKPAVAAVRPVDGGKCGCPCGCCSRTRRFVKAVGFVLAVFVICFVTCKFVCCCGGKHRHGPRHMAEDGVPAERAERPGHRK